MCWSLFKQVADSVMLLVKIFTSNSAPYFYMDALNVPTTTVLLNVGASVLPCVKNVESSTFYIDIDEHFLDFKFFGIRVVVRVEIVVHGRYILRGG